MDFYFEKAVESLVFLACGDHEKNESTILRSANIKDFDGFELFYAGDDVDYGDDFVLKAKSVKDLAVWPLDVRFAHYSPNEKTWQFTRISSMTDKSKWRGRANFFSNHMAELRFMKTHENGNCFSEIKPLAVFGNRCITADRLVPYTKRGWGRLPPDYWGSRHSSKRDFADITSIFEFSQGMALRKRYNWSVLLGETGYPRVRWTTDVEGIKEVFRLRDIPPGKLRRAALLNWVKAHWRKSRKPNADDLDFVKRYLRGAWGFTYNGLECSIEPPEFDIERHLEEQAS